MKRISEILGIVLSIVIMAGLGIADLFIDNGLFSAAENRLLEQKPKFSLQTLLQDKYTEDYEAYLSDQFLFRAKWITMKTYGDLALGKKEVKGIYFLSDGRMAEQHLPEEYEKKEGKLKALVDFLEKCSEIIPQDKMRVMLVPTADEIYKEELPAYAPSYDQSDFLKQAKDILNEQAGEHIFIHTEDILRKNCSSYIYYRTDHHWTTYGAYLAYREYCNAIGIEAVSIKNMKRVEVSSSFLGTLHSKVNIQAKEDHIWRYDFTVSEQIKVFYDLSEEAREGMYEEKHLKTKNQYGYFLDDNHALVRLETGVSNGKTLLIVKDSFANCFVPFLINHYERILVVDPRYYKAQVTELMEQENVTDLLVLYNVIHFLDEFPKDMK